MGVRYSVGVGPVRFYRGRSRARQSDEQRRQERFARLKALTDFAEDRRQPSELRAIAWQAQRMRLREAGAEHRGRGWTILLSVAALVLVISMAGWGWGLIAFVAVIVAGSGLTMARARVHGRMAEAAEARLQARRDEAAT